MVDFKFPLENQDDYKGRVIFTAYKEDYKTVASTGFDLISSNARQSRVDQLVEQGVDLTFATKQAQNEKDQLNKLYNSEASRDTRKPIPRRIGNKRRCQLYLPSTLQFQDRVEYTNVDLNVIGSAAAQALQQGGSGADLLRSAFGNALPSFESLSEAVRTGLQSEAAQVAALRVARGLSSDVTGAIETTTGVTLNPNRRQTLKGVGIRQFRFAFKLIPTSQKEAIEITKIIQFFREEMYPETSGEGLQAALKFPSKFDIQLRYGNRKVATGILPCFLETVDVAYNPTNMGFHEDGNFQETDISLSFVEERALTKRDILAEVNPDFNDPRG
jgi:hypothetical protein